jgi:hypothetical protein
VPVHPPDAVQLVALALLHVSVELLPLVIEVGLAARTTVGVGGALTATVVEAGVLVPPAPVHVSV